MCEQIYDVETERQEKLNKSIKVSTDKSFLCSPKREREREREREKRKNKLFLCVQTKRLFLPINFIY